MELRLEEKADYAAVENLTREAFWNVYRPGCDEHLLVHKIRAEKSFVKELDYVVVKDEKIVGNIIYSKVFYGPERTMCDDIIAFGPVSVHPDYQKKGIGKYLINSTIQKARVLGYKAVMITGDSNYYQPLGFVSATRHKILMPGMSEQEEASFFMVYELEPGYLDKHPGVYDFDTCFVINADEVEVFDKKFPPKTKREARETDLV